MYQVIINVGCPGSGKTHWTNKYVDSLPEDVSWAVVSADHFFSASGEYIFNPAALHLAHQFCQNNFVTFLEEKKNVIIVDNTSTRASERKFYLQKAREHGYEVWLKVFATSPELAAARNIHNVAADKVAQMAARVDVKPGFFQIV